jgi:hypothetical protein
MPNSDGEIHLEKQHKKAIWKEYADDQKYLNRAFLGYDAFLKLWRECFSHVKIRCFKNVSGLLMFMFQECD